MLKLRDLIYNFTLSLYLDFFAVTNYSRQYCLSSQTLIETDVEDVLIHLTQTLPLMLLA